MSPEHRGGELLPRGLQVRGTPLKGYMLCLMPVPSLLTSSEMVFGGNSVWKL